MYVYEKLRINLAFLRKHCLTQKRFNSVSARFVFYKLNRRFKIKNKYLKY